MKIWNGIDDFPERRSKVVGSIGNFDGVHVGHREILDRVVREADRRDLSALLITFDPHPLSVVAPERRPRLLQTRRQKLASLEATGLTDLLLLDFNREIAGLGAEDFFFRLLAPRIDFAALHVGENFRFGKDRAGDMALLERIGERLGFEVASVSPLRIDGEVVSSTTIRQAVLAGAVDRAREMLGRPFELTGEVFRGAGRGRGLEFPTANVKVENEVVPRFGVYVTEVLALARRYPAITNVGVRPTFGGKKLTVESHLMDFSGDLYARRIEVRFLARLRDEMRFGSPVELADQIARDRAAAESYFQNMQFQA